MNADTQAASRVTTASDTMFGISLPDVEVDAHELFGIDVDMKVKAFSVRTPHVPDIDTTYRFDRETTLAILAGFQHNRRVMIQGYHGTG